MNLNPYQDLFDGNIDISLKTAANILASYPASGAAFMRLSKAFRKAQEKRARAKAKGLEVPPLLIVSTTGACNLRCEGCYAKAQKSGHEEGLSNERISEVFKEASSLGVSVVMLAGGEPFLSHGWMDALAKDNEIAGIVFTNGTLFNQSKVEWFSRYRHIIPTFSIEGNEALTDGRRGAGVYAKVNSAMATLKKNGIPFGISVTATSGNIGDILNDKITSEYLGKGCRLFVFVEYVPVEAEASLKALSNTEKKKLAKYAETSASRHPALFIAFPGDEEQYGGCLAAGRGFLHISSSGDVEPCPFAPFSDANLNKMRLRDALKSSFLAKVREGHNMLNENGSGCSLWQNQDLLRQLMQAR